MNRYWKTQSGERISYEEIEDRHLLNILRFLERRAIEGIKVINLSLIDAGDKSGIDFEPSDCYRVIHGKEALQVSNYYLLKEEALKRNII